MLYFEGIPFCCRKCHITSHIATHCVAMKTKLRRPPSWWLGASSKHYTVLKSMVFPFKPMGDSSLVDAFGDHSVPVVVEDVQTSGLDPVPSATPTPISYSLPSLIGG